MSEADDARALRRDVPVPGAPDGGVWGSDAIALMLRALDIPYVCLNPGASFRGLHDSLVNCLGNERPQMLVCLHEEHAVAIAHGYAKVTGTPLAAIVHSNVGLMHASMAMFNAWCDRLPVIVLGATGPVDAAKRRPWIDWIHTMRDQGALVRSFVKWDDQPASVPAAYEALLRARQIAQTAPMGPVYVNLDVSLQEDRLASLPPLPEVARYLPPPPVHAAPAAIAQAAQWLREAQRPLLLMGRATRDQDEWNARVALAEALGARVLTDLKVGAAFPTDHPLHAAPPGVFLPPAATAVVRDADVVLALDWVDLAGTLKQAWGTDTVTSRVINVSPDQHAHHGAGMEYHALPPADLYLLCDAATVVHDLRQAVGSAAQRPVPASVANGRDDAATAAAQGPITIAAVAQALERAAQGIAVSLTHLPLGWSGEMWHFRHPLDFLGSDGGAADRCGTGPYRGRRDRAQGHRADARRHPRRRRFPDGRDRAVERRQRARAAARRGVQQPLVLQRRDPSGTRSEDARATRREQVDRPAHRRSRARPGTARASAGYDGHRPGDRRAGAARGARRRGRAGLPRRGGGRRRARGTRLQPVDGRRRGPRARDQGGAMNAVTSPTGKDLSPARVLPQHRDLFYGGAWHAPHGGRYADTLNPAEDAPLAAVAEADAADVDAAVHAAHAAFAGWRALKPLQRAEAMRAAAAILRANAEELAMLDALNTGNPVAEMVADARVAAGAHEYFAGLAMEAKGVTVPMGPDHLNYTLREPLGVVARIVAYNHPLMFAAAKIAAPLAAGNTVIVKAAGQAPLSALRMAELIGGCFPPGVLNVLAGDRACGEALSTHPLVRKVT